MKKTYLKPEMEMETIELENMIAASPILSEEDADPEEEVFGRNRNNGDWSGLLW